MKELFDKFLMYFCFAGIGTIAVVAFVRVTLPAAATKACSVARKAKKAGPAVIIPILCVAGLIVYGSTKNNSPTNEPPAQTRMNVQSASNALVRVEKWWRRGAYDDGQILMFDEDWCFPYGTNHLTSVEVWASGAVYPSMKSPTPIAGLLTKLSLTPHDTEVFMGRTTNNTYRIEWHNGHPNRDLNQIADASIELFRNGNVVVTENGVETEIPYDILFEHDGFGQDDDWVRANFTRLQQVSPSLTSAEEIISIGYANWVDQQVGVGLTNGLYKFTALFEDDPPEPTELYIGDYSVCVTNAGEYVFVLEKGEEYEFGTWPFNDDVDYWAQDDLGSDAPMLTAWWGGWESPGEWTIDGGWNWFWRPSFSYGRYYKGYCAWGPTLQGSPDVVHLRESDFPKLFSAIVTDYKKSDDLQYEWKSSDKNIRIMSPHSKETLIAVDSMPSWDHFDLSVSTEIKGRSYTSAVTMCYGTNETPVVSLALSAPKVVFVNDDDRTSRWYRVSAKLSSPTPTNAVLSVSHTGGAQILYATDPEGKNRFAMTNVNLVVDSPVSSTRYDFYFAATNNNCTGKFTATCTLTNSTALVANREYKVIEPLRKLVSTVKANDGSYVNPSRLAYGTNVWLEVDQNGTFPSQDIRWRIVSGPGTLVSTNRYRACVRATAQTGTVVVEAAFGSDALVQPRFVLPIVQKRRIAVKAFAVADVDGSLIVTESDVDGKIESANDIYNQVGIEFYRNGPVCAITNSTFLVIEEHGLTTNRQGRVRLSPYPSVQVNDLVNCVKSAAGGPTEINLVWVNEIVRGTPVAFTMSTDRVCVFAKNYQYATSSVCAHEIGHVLGLRDVYNARKTTNDPMPQGWLPLYEEVFSDPAIDWVGDDGRGFYESTDTHRDVIELLLMHGRDSGGCDIPSGSVRGFSSQARNIFDMGHVPVGASAIQ